MESVLLCVAASDLRRSLGRECIAAGLRPLAPRTLAEAMRLMAEEPPRAMIVEAHPVAFAHVLRAVRRVDRGVAMLFFSDRSAFLMHPLDAFPRDVTAAVRSAGVLVAESLARQSPPPLDEARRDIVLVD